MEEFSRCTNTLPSTRAVKQLPRAARCARLPLVTLLLLLSLASSALGREPKKKVEYGTGFSTEITSPQETVLQAVADVVNDGIIQGSREYNKDKYVENAVAATSSPLFEPWKGPGRVFYKVRKEVLAPANFKEAMDQGTLAVRYIVSSKSAQQTVLRIDAIYVEEFRHAVHASDGSVENAEFRDIQDHVDALELEKKQAADSERHRQEELAKKALEQKNAAEVASAAAPPQTLAETPEQQLANLRRQVERIVKAPGAQLKSAPFHSATNLKTLDPGTEVVILIATPYWDGVEAEDGQHGWINRSQLEPLP
ncbi:MAG: hypothetical protein ACRD3L_05540 [Terriglobales bacterium]